MATKQIELDLRQHLGGSAFDFLRANHLLPKFRTPELPQSRTMDGQAYGHSQDHNHNQFANSQIFEGQVVNEQVIEQGQFQGRIIEGRVLIGQDGQSGDMTLRFPDSAASSSENDGAMIFGPIETEPLPAISPQQITGPTQRENQRATSFRQRKRKQELNSLPNREIIRQRYPDGNVQIARHVKQDMQGNWVNDGQWKLFDRQGALIASGNYRNGLMDGKWSRLHTAGSGGIFNNVPFIEFDGPFASHATFESGKLSGPWIIQDRQGRKILEIPYENGRRNGVAVWYLPQGKIYRRMEFADDVPVGKLVEYDNQGKIRRKETYKDGMKIVNNVTYYRPSGQKRQESIVRRGRLKLQGEDDWWEAKPAPMVVTGKDVQHGPVRSWYENGQTKMVGNLDQGLRVGVFNWWHRNGTKQLTGQYDKFGNKTGRWRWWHDNGIKSIDGSYNEGEAKGIWRWWNAQGALVNEEDFDAQGSLEDTSNNESKDEVSTQHNPEDPFGEELDENSILSDDSAVNPDGVDDDAGAPNNKKINTDVLEGIEPESLESEEIPEPDNAGQTPASIGEELRDKQADSEIETFFEIQDDQ